MKALYQWLGKHVHAPYGSFLFAFLVFIEGFFVMPVSTMLAFFSLENRQKAFFYAFLATFMSAAGALAGYLLGTLLWKAGGTTFLYYIIDEKKFTDLVQQFKTYQTWTTFFVALSPMPFKLLTISAGFMHVPLVPFILCSMVARGIRFFAISGAIAIWGEKVQYYLNNYFYTVMTIGIVLFIALWYFMH